MMMNDGDKVNSAYVLDGYHSKICMTRVHRFIILVSIFCSNVYTAVTVVLVLRLVVLVVTFVVFVWTHVVLVLAETLLLYGILKGALFMCIM